MSRATWARIALEQAEANAVATPDAVRALAHRASDAAVLLFDLPDLVRFERMRRGLTIREVADATGIGHSHVSAIENGTYHPSVRNAIRLLEWLATP
jgi:DNA-binding XRE family transcriptional regulator